MATKKVKQTGSSRTAANKLGRTGGFAMSAVRDLIGLFDPLVFWFGGADDPDTSEIPLFVAILAILLALVVFGVAIYIAAILLGQLWLHFL